MKTIATRRDVSVSEAEDFLRAALDEIIEQLVRVGRVKLGDFGTFEVKLRRERRGRNPRTGDKLMIPASIYPKFKPGRRLKERVGQLSEVPDPKKSAGP